jgi:hypothetical protein
VKIEEDNAEDKLKLEPSNGENSPIVNDLQSTPGGITIMGNIPEFYGYFSVSQN